MPNMDYSLIQRTPDGTGKILVTIPGIPDKGSYVLEADLKIYTNQGMVAIADIVDDLVTADATKPLSANQGVVLKQLIDAVSGGITPKGDILSSNLPAADDSNKGWQYYCTDINKWATSDGTQWVYTSNSIIVQTPDATDTGHALSNAVVTQCCNEVKGRLNQHESRLQNLEQKAGDYSVVQYRGTDAVPTGKASYGLVKKIVGKTRAWNQLVQNGNFATTDNWSTASNVTAFTVSGNVATISVNSGSNNTFIDQYDHSFVSGHKYLVMFEVYNVDGQTSANPYFTTYPYDLNYRGDDTVVGQWTHVEQILTASITQTTRIRVGMREGSATDSWSYKMRNCNIFDLTLIFGAGNEPSTVTEALAQLPALGEYNAYDAGSLVSTAVSGVKSVEFNIWDEEWENGYYNANTGQPVVNPNRIRSKNYIKVSPNTSYCYRTSTGHYCRVIYYDGNKNYIGAGNNDGLAVYVGTTPSNCQYIRFYQANDATSYNNDICINISQPNTAISPHNGDYVPYKTDSLSFSETVTLKSAGSVSDELDVESGVITRKVGSIVLDGSVDENYSSYSSSYDGFPININGMSIDATNPSTQLVSDVFITNTVRGNSGSGLLLKTWTSTDSIVAIFLCGTGETTVAGLRTWLASHITTINYNLATPTTESIDPITDNFIEVQGGGTVETIQEQTPVIDNCLDVGYLTV